MVRTVGSVPRASRRDLRFALRYRSWVLNLLNMISSASERSGLTVDDEEVRVRMMPACDITIPRDSITRIWRTRAGDQGILFWIPPIFGAHSNLQGVWWINGSVKNLVAIDIDPRASGRVWGIVIRPRRVVVSLVDPDGFIAETLE